MRGDVAQSEDCRTAGLVRRRVCFVKSGPGRQGQVASVTVAASLLLTSYYMPEFGVYEQTYKELETPYHVHSSRLKNKVPMAMIGQFSASHVISENSHLCRTHHYSR